ncbi:MAG: Na+/H+ antiporter NhaA [Ilumatobacter sp.]|uniref:Na+/H+ antiporter NhaA n=1 Tax=Ilumatobacter sp. TaxID=1967498 RepID=UPI00329871AE
MNNALRPAYSASDRPVPRRVIQPVRRFMAVETAGGVVMLAGAIIALIWANSPWDASYVRFFETPIELRVGGVIDLDLTVHEWVNDGLMSLFFLVVGLEIKRQLVHGELRDRRAAALPAVAALGGMIVPAAIYILFNLGGATDGFGVPVATDIAFAVGVVTLAGSRVPLGVRIFILTLAVVDDIGGIVVIAVFYAEGVSFAWLGAAVACIVGAYVSRRLEVRSLVPYLAFGTVCWYSLHSAGVEAAIVGVVFGLLAPAHPFHDPSRFGERIEEAVRHFERTDHNVPVEIATYVREVASPLDRVEHHLTPWVSFLIVPIFALANAGVSVSTAGLDVDVFAGVAAGLVIGKIVGIVSFTWLAVRFGVGRLPQRTGWLHILGVGAAGGIGFTVALFVAGLSFDDADLLRSAKLGILAASTTAGLLAYAILRLASREERH